VVVIEVGRGGLVEPRIPAQLVCVYYVYICMCVFVCVYV